RIPRSRGSIVGHAWPAGWRSEDRHRASAAADRKWQSVACQRPRIDGRSEVERGRPQRRARNLQDAGRRFDGAAKVAGASRRDGGRSRILTAASRTMNRRNFTALLLSLAPAGCDWFRDKKQPLTGERIWCLGLDTRFAPDPQLASVPVALPPPVSNADWPQPGGNPAHAMVHPALPDKIARAWDTSIGEGAPRRTRVLSQPIVAQGRVFAMDGGVQVSAIDAGTGSRIWQVDLKREGMRGNAFGGGPCFWNDRLYVSTGY